jgi:hypothetical protein
MVQLALLAACWLLLRRYVLRRRTRLVRESTVRRMTSKLRAMARRTGSKSSRPARKRSSLATLSV